MKRLLFLFVLPDLAMRIFNQLVIFMLESPGLAAFITQGTLQSISRWQVQER